MAALTSAVGYMCDTLAGYLLVIAITSGFSLVNKLKLPRVTAPLKLHSSLPDLKEFNPIECLVLYLVSYPALAMYRTVPLGHIVGYTALAVGLLMLLLLGIGPAIIKMKKEVTDTQRHQCLKPSIADLGTKMGKPAGQRHK